VREPATSCSNCGKLLAESQVLYSARGEIVCQACTTAEEVATGLQKSAEMARGLAYGNVLLGVASFFFDPFFVLSFGAIGNGLYVFRRLRSEMRRGEKVFGAGSQRVAAGVGMALGVLSLALRLLPR
jgi:hypothetical protein